MGEDTEDMSVERAGRRRDGRLFQVCAGGQREKEGESATVYATHVLARVTYTTFPPAAAAAAARVVYRPPHAAAAAFEP